MSGFDKNAVNRVIVQLDESGCLFPQFGLSKLNNELVLLGQGGFSSVYEMYNKERPDLKFALKVIGFERHTISSAEFWNTGRIQWILCQESRYVARVFDARELIIDTDENGNLHNVKVLDVTKERWEDEENGLHLQLVLMEKLEAIIVKDRFKKVSLLREKLNTEEEVLKFALEIGQALNIAHGYSVLHRDIKLENIFWDDTEKVYKLGDFGIAKYAEDGNAETVVYTDGYGAPEIERRLYDYYNATADIYSFGITLYLLLNDLRFPGSEGYYPKVEVQYNPDYVFPAPKHASEGMAKIIRKMCSFNAEDRYQCMADALSDLVMNNELEGADIPDDLIDMATETYREESKETEDDEPIERPKTRAERKEEQKIIDQLYKEDSIKYGIAITIIMALLFVGMHGDVKILNNWLFMVLPIAVLFESIFQRVKEFHIFFGALVIGFIGISAVQMGVTMPHVVMAIVVLADCPVLTVSGAIASGIWIGFLLSDKMDILSFIYKYDLGWILLIVLFIALNRYFHMRIEWKKTTYFRAYIGYAVYDKGLPGMVLAGIVLLILQHFNVLVIPELINRIHLIRTGIISFVIICFLFWRDGYLDDDKEEMAIGDEEIEDANNLDK